MSSYLALAIVAGLAGIERKGVLQAMLSRPVALGAIAGLVTGDVAGGLVVGVPLELLWLGSVNLGAALPVHEALGTVAAAGGAVLAASALGSGVTFAIATLAVLICAPLALAGRRWDLTIERTNERLVSRAEALVEQDPAAAARTNLLGLALPFAFPAIVAPLGAAVCVAAIPRILRAAPGLEPALGVAWVAFGVAAACAGAVSLRGTRTPTFFFAAATATAAAAALVVAVGGAR